MKITNRPFYRRPWDSGDNGMIRHFDGIHLVDPGQRGFYFCLHTGQAFLKQNSVVCEPLEGFSWEGLVLENFTVTGAVDEAVYITDGKQKHTVTIQYGEIVGSKAKAVVLDNLDLSVFTLRSVKTAGPVHFQNTQIDKIVIQDCSNIKLTCDTSTFTAIELWHCTNIDTSELKIQPTVYEVSSVRSDLQASFAINIIDAGVIYGIDIPAAQLKPRSPK